MKIPDGSAMDPAPGVGGGGGYINESVLPDSDFQLQFLGELGHVFERMEPLLITPSGEAVFVAMQRISSMLGS